MQPTEEWIEEWIVGLNLTYEREVGSALLGVFSGFWETAELGQKSETTQRRYSGSLHALGGHLVAQASSAISGEDETRSLHELLWEAVELGEGPLIFPDHEQWQRELDTTCRKLRRYLKDPVAVERMLG